VHFFLLSTGAPRRQRPALGCQAVRPRRTSILSVSVVCLKAVAFVAAGQRKSQHRWQDFIFVVFVVSPCQIWNLSQPVSGLSAATTSLTLCDRWSTPYQQSCFAPGLNPLSPPFQSRRLPSEFQGSDRNVSERISSSPPLPTQVRLFAHMCPLFARTNQIAPLRLSSFTARWPDAQRQDHRRRRRCLQHLLL